MIGTIAGGIAWTRYLFWKLLAAFCASSIGKGTKIYEGVKISMSSKTPVVIGQRCSLQKGAVVSASESGKVVLHDSVYLGEYVVLGAKKGIEIGENTLIAPHTCVVDFNHRFDDPSTAISNQGCDCAEVFIGKDVWVGAGCRILKGVKIGDGSVIGAGSVVTRDVAPFTVVAGVPAKIMKQRR